MVTSIRVETAAPQASEPIGFVKAPVREDECDSPTVQSETQSLVWALPEKHCPKYEAEASLEGTASADTHLPAASFASKSDEDKGVLFASKSDEDKGMLRTYVSFEDINPVQRTTSREPPVVQTSPQGPISNRTSESAWRTAIGRLRSFFNGLSQGSQQHQHWCQGGRLRRCFGQVLDDGTESQVTQLRAEVLAETLGRLRAEEEVRQLQNRLDAYHKITNTF